MEEYLYNNNRRLFLKKSLLAATGLALTGPMAFAAKNKKITLLHTNDVHSRIDPFPNDGSKYAGKGGIAARKRLIDGIRATEKNVLLLDCGDMFQGTPYFNFFKGEPEIKAMQLLGYQAATMGNHDFDEGIENFAKQLRHAQFPILVANYSVEGTPLMGKIKPYKIFEFDELKVGVIGLGIALDGLVPETLTGNTVYRDPVPIANEIAKKLKTEQGCQAVVVISHLGYKYGSNKVSDTVLAEESEHIDVILGGHTHTFLDEPTTIKNKLGRTILINQVGFAGLRLGRIDLYFDKVGKQAFIKSNNTWV